MQSSRTQLWLDKAAEDEQVLHLLKAAGGPWSMAAYHIQQVAEKTIKAVLVETGVAPPRTHDLQQRLALYAGSVPETVRQAAAMLSAYSWMTRYPGAPSISEQDVIQAEIELFNVQSWASVVIR